MKKIFFFITFIILVLLFTNQSILLQKKNMVLANIEVLAQIEESVKIRSCYMDQDITEDLSSASRYTICNSQTNSSTMYRCGKEKQGNFKEYSTPISYKCMHQ